MSRRLAQDFLTPSTLLAIFLAILICLPEASLSQNAEYDPEWFDCKEIRRDGDFLVYWDLAVIEFSCDSQSCVSREHTTERDGTISELFRHIYFPDGGGQFLLTTSVWREGAQTPKYHKMRERPLIGCFTMEPDEELWTQDLARAEYVGDEVHANNRIGDYRADYFYAPTRLLGDWSDATAIVFEKKSSGGTYLSAYYQDIYGDVVLKNGSMRATYEISEHHTGEWRLFRVSLDDPGWRLKGGANSIDDILENVTVFQIRAEYGNGADTSAIRNVIVE